MRRRARPVLLALAVCTVCGAASASARTGGGRPAPGDVRTCATRGDSVRPATPPAGGTAVGLIVLWKVTSLSPTADAAWPYAQKMPAVVPARVRVTLAIAPESTGVAALWKRGGGYVSAVRFVACRERERAWTYDGTVGRYTQFPFAIALKQPSACVVMQAWVDGEAAPHTVTVGIGRRDCV
ncbi:MAG TPA: hypothetical protein VHC01_15245 [Gaiellaceae bacterium]|nr:hypothetical protein [Gaiellaceae bacterium]